MATKEEVAQWMVNEFNDKGHLSQSRAARHIKTAFGEEFVYKNKNHNTAINKEVLAEFKKLTGSDAVWVKSAFRWRKRKEKDKPGRQQG